MTGGRIFRERVHRPSATALRRVAPGRRVLVVGGGIAGVAASVVLAERGATVTLVERAPFLGGRAAAWTDALSTGEPFEMERGFHAFFRQYYNLRALLRRVDPSLSVLRELADYPILGPDGRVESFAKVPRRPPFNLLGLLARTSALRARDLGRIDAAAAAAMMAFDPAATYARFDATTARDYLDSLRFPPHARRMLFDVFAHSFFNPEAAMSAAELLMMFHFYFLGNPEGLVFDVAREPFSTALWKPFERHLERLGVRLLLGQRVTRLLCGGEGSRRGRAEIDGATGATPLDFDAVVLAVDVPALRAIVAASPGLGDAAWRASIAGLATTLPFAVYRLWLDHPCAPSRAPFAGTTGIGLLDNISLYHLFEGESAGWAARTGGAVVELHGYAVPRDWDEARIKRDLLDGLRRFYPETRGARVLEERFLLREDCPAFEPGSFARRPGPEGPEPWLALAGDFVRLAFPTALMERAASSGFLAANHLLRAWGVQGEEIWSVPRRGLLAPLSGGKIHRKTGRQEDY
jgi:isorenieratene synthase